MRAKVAAWMKEQNDQGTVFDKPLLLGEEATLLPTGAVVGTGSHLFGGGRFGPKSVPSFAWWDGESMVEHRLDAFTRTARTAAFHVSKIGFVQNHSVVLETQAAREFRVSRSFLLIDLSIRENCGNFLVQAIRFLSFSQSSFVVLEAFDNFHCCSPAPRPIALTTCKHHVVAAGSQ